MINTNMLLIILIGICIIGLPIIYKNLKNNKLKAKSKLELIISVFKFIINNEKITPPGKVNLGGCIIVAIIAVLLEYPLVFAFLYRIVFKESLIDLNFLNYVLVGVFGCAIPISIIEAILINKKSNMLEK